MVFAEIISIAPFEWQAVGTALVCGGIIGLERQLRGKPVGIRTSALIVLGTYIFIAASMLVFLLPETVGLVLSSYENERSATSIRAGGLPRASTATVTDKP